MKTSGPKNPGGAARARSSSAPGDPARSTSGARAPSAKTAEALEAHRAELEQKKAQTAEELEAWRAEEGGFTSMSRVALATKELATGDHSLKSFVRAAGDPEATGPSPLRLRMQALQGKIDLVDKASARVTKGEAPLQEDELGVDLTLDEIALALNHPMTREDLVAHRSAFLLRAIEDGDVDVALETYAALGALYLEAPSSTGDSAHRVGGKPSLTSLVNGWVLTGRLRTRGSLVLTADDLEKQSKRILKLAKRLAKEGAFPGDAPPVTKESLAAEVKRLRALEASPEQRQLLDAGVLRGHEALQKSVNGEKLSRFGKGVLRIADDPSTWAMVLVGALAGYFGRASMAAAKSATVGAGQVAAASEGGVLRGVTLRRFVGTRAAEGVGFHLGMNAFEYARNKGDRATWGLSDFARSVALFEVLGAVHLRPQFHHIENKVLRHAAALGEETLGLSLLGLGEVWLRGGDGQDALELVEHNLQFLLAMRLLSGAQWAKGGFKSEAPNIAANKAAFNREFKRSRRAGLSDVEQRTAVRNGCFAFLDYAEAVTREIGGLREDGSVPKREPIRFKHRGVETTAEGLREAARILGGSPEFAARAAAGGGLYPPRMPVPMVDGAKAVEEPGLWTHELMHRKIWSLEPTARKQLFEAMERSEALAPFLESSAFAGAAADGKVTRALAGEELISEAAAGKLSPDKKAAYEAFQKEPLGTGTVLDFMAKNDMHVSEENRAAWTRRASLVRAPVEYEPPRAAGSKPGDLEDKQSELSAYAFAPKFMEWLTGQIRGEGFDIFGVEPVFGVKSGSRGEVREVGGDADARLPLGARQYWKAVLGVDQGDLPVFIDIVGGHKDLVDSCANDFLSANIGAVPGDAREVPLKYRWEGDRYHVVMPESASPRRDPSKPYSNFEVAWSLSRLFADLAKRPRRGLSALSFVDRNRAQFSRQYCTEARFLEWGLHQLANDLPGLLPGSVAFDSKEGCARAVMTTARGELPVEVYLVDNPVPMEPVLVRDRGTALEILVTKNDWAAAGRTRDFHQVLSGLAQRLQPYQADRGGGTGQADRGVEARSGRTSGRVERISRTADGRVILPDFVRDHPRAADYRIFRAHFNAGVNAETVRFVSIPCFGSQVAGRLLKIEPDHIVVELEVEKGQREEFKVEGEELLKVRVSGYSSSVFQELLKQPQVYRPPIVRKTDFDPAPLIRALDAVIGPGRYSAMVHQTIRRQVRALLDSYGLESADLNRPNRDRFVAINDPKSDVAGQHTWMGTAKAIDPDIERAAQLLRHMFEPGVPCPRNLDNCVDGLLTLLHEELHGYSKQEWSAYADYGKTVEETATEVACRAIGRHVLAKRGLRSSRTDLPAEGAKPRWAYDSKTRFVLETVQRETGWDWAQCCAALEEASLRLKEQGVTTAVEPEQLLTSFVERLPIRDGGKRDRISAMIRAKNDAV